MERPDKLPEGAQFLMFVDKIEPVWEDPQNANGGRFILRVRRGWGSRVWEELLLSYIGIR
jgi:translation initiation factor 4E